MGVEYYLVCHEHYKKAFCYKKHPGKDGEWIHTKELAMLFLEHQSCHLGIMKHYPAEVDGYQSVGCLEEEKEEADSCREELIESYDFSSKDSKMSHKKLEEKAQDIMEREIKTYMDGMVTEIRNARRFYDAAHRKMKDLVTAAEDFNKRFDSMDKKFDSHALGVQNVYEKFLELEKRQKEITEEKLRGILEDEILIYKGEINDASDRAYELSKEYEIICENIRESLGSATCLHERLDRMDAKFDSNAVGVQNVYNKFLELEKRQLCLEESLLSNQKVSEE